jgi:hypothetical protein
MPRSRRRECESYRVFKANLDRSKAFFRLFDAGGGRGQPSNDRKELLRGAVVFAVGSLDAFLHDLVLEIVPEYGPNSPELTTALKEIAKDDPGLALRVALQRNPDEAVRQFRSALDSWLSIKSFQGPEAVVRACAYVGCTLGWQELDAVTHVNTAAKLGEFTRMRHDVVHRGRRPYIRRHIAQECVDLIAAVANAINDKVVSTYGSGGGLRGQQSRSPLSRASSSSRRASLR